jgi:hypothetical protein
MILNFYEIYNSKYKEYLDKIKRLEIGVQKLDDTEIKVAELEIELMKLSPVLEQAKMETIQLLNQLKTEMAQADEEQRKLSLEESEAALI